MSDTCAGWRGPLAVYALGQSSRDERVAVEAHLEGCDRCRGELAELAVPARALAATEADRVGRRRRKVLADVAVAAAVAVVLGSLSLSRHATSQPRERVALRGAAGVHADVVVVARPRGTQLTVTAGGLAAGSVHSMWVEAGDGRRTPAGTFTAVRDHRIRVVLARPAPPIRSLRSASATQPARPSCSPSCADPIHRMDRSRLVTPHRLSVRAVGGQPARKPWRLSIPAEGWRSLHRARASSCRIRSELRPSWAPTSDNERASPRSRP